MHIHTCIILTLCLHENLLFPFISIPVHGHHCRAELGPDAHKCVKSKTVCKMQEEDRNIKEKSLDEICITVFSNDPCLQICCDVLDM